MNPVGPSTGTAQEFLPLLCPRCRQPLAEPAICVGCGASYRGQDGILRLAAGGEGPAGFDPAYYEQLSEVEEHQFWFVARRELIVESLYRSVPDLDTRPLFDVGCGAGGLLAFLHARGIRLAGACDTHIEGLRIARTKVNAPLALVAEGTLPPLASGQRLISMFDVLEHLDDDAGAVRWAASVLEPGGIFALTVPAHPFLYDEMDRLAFHRRRYTRAVLGDLLATAGFEIRVLTYVMSLLVPLLLLVRGVGSLLAPIWTPAARRGAELRAHPIANKVLLAALRRERRLRSGRDLPFGLSLLAVAARPVATAAGDGSGRR